MSMPSKVVLGWREWVALPTLGVGAIRAKIDSGARSTALHVDDQWRFSERGAPWVGFRLTPAHAGEAIECTAPVVDERTVVDSGGHGTLRVFIRTTLRVAGVEREIDINLTRRHGMAFPMLLGRTAMVKAFTVDPARSFLHGRAGPPVRLHVVSPDPARPHP